MASTGESKSSSHCLGKLLVIKEERDEYDGQLIGYMWVNKPGLSVSVQQLQPQQPILHVDTSLLKYLTELLQSEPCVGWAVHSVGALKEVGLTGVDMGYPEHEISVIIVTEGQGK